MKNLLEFILIHLVDHPDDVQIEELTAEDGSIEYMLHVHKEDLGRVIGRHGNVIQSIRSITKVRAIKENLRVRVSVAE